MSEQIVIDWHVFAANDANARCTHCGKTRAEIPAGQRCPASPQMQEEYQRLYRAIRQ